MPKLTEEMSNRYGFTLVEMNRIMKLTLKCSNYWTAGEMSKSQIVDYIASETEGNIRMGILTGMSTGAMIGGRSMSIPSAIDLLDALQGLEK